MVISRRCILSTTRFITSIGQGEPAMMPVRSVDRSNSAKRGWSSSAMNMVGTPCRPVHFSACTVSSTVSGSKPSFGIDDGRAMREAGQVAQHHAEAVVQRHRDAQPVGRRELHALADEEAVVQDVAMRQRRALGKAGGAAGELDVDRVGRPSALLRRSADAAGRPRSPLASSCGEALQAGLVGALPVGDRSTPRAQLRQPRDFNSPGWRAASSGASSRSMPR